MFCRSCGKSVNEQAIACVSCGVPPLGGNKFCQSCGAETNPAAVMCVKCGVPVKTQKPAKTLSTKSDEAVFLGLNQTGVIAFIILLLVCFPLCWLPFVLGQCKAK